MRPERQNSAYAAALPAAVALVLATDLLGSSDDSGQVSLLVLLVACAWLGFAEPPRAWLAGLALGSSLAVANAVYATLGPARPHPIHPGGLPGAATLLVLVVPALVAALLGAAAGRGRLARGN